MLQQARPDNANMPPISSRVLILNGPPGVGKTTLAKVIATESGSALGHLNYKTIKSWKDIGSKSIAQMFERAIGLRVPCIILIHETADMAKSSKGIDIKRVSDTLYEHILSLNARGNRLISVILTTSRYNELSHNLKAWSKKYTIHLPDRAEIELMMRCYREAKECPSDVLKPLIDHFAIDNASRCDIIRKLQEIIVFQKEHDVNLARQGIVRPHQGSIEASIIARYLRRNAPQLQATRAASENNSREPQALTEGMVPAAGRREQEGPPPLECSFKECKITRADLPGGVHPVIDSIIEKLRYKVGSSNAGTELMSRVLILDGPPGSGKTTLARVMAAETGCLLGEIICSKLMNEWKYSGPRYVAELFKQAIKISETDPCIILINEIDAITSRNSDNHEIRGIATTMLQAIDDLPANQPIYVILTTNHYDELPQPLTDRAERVTVDLPERTEIKEMILFYMRKSNCEFLPGILNVLLDHFEEKKASRRNIHVTLNDDLILAQQARDHRISRTAGVSQQPSRVIGEASLDFFLKKHGHKPNPVRRKQWLLQLLKEEARVENVSRTAAPQLWRAHIPQKFFGTNSKPDPRDLAILDTCLFEANNLTEVTEKILDDLLILTEGLSYFQMLEIMRKAKSYAGKYGNASGNVADIFLLMGAYDFLLAHENNPEPGGHSFTRVKNNPQIRSRIFTRFLRADSTFYDNEAELLEAAWALGKAAHGFTIKNMEKVLAKAHGSKANGSYGWQTVSKKLHLLVGLYGVRRELIIEKKEKKRASPNAREQFDKNADRRSIEEQLLNEIVDRVDEDNAAACFLLALQNIQHSVSAEFIRKFARGYSQLSDLRKCRVSLHILNEILIMAIQTAQYKFGTLTENDIATAAEETIGFRVGETFRTLPCTYKKELSDIEHYGTLLKMFTH